VATAQTPKPDAAGMDSHFRGNAHDYSLVLGGPLFQLFRKSHLAGDDFGLINRRILVITGIAWLPLLLLSTMGLLLGRPGRIGFFTDIEVHARFLVALPVLILAESVVHARLTPVVRRFVERRIVPPRDVPRFDQAIASAVRLRNSVSVEIGLIAIVYIAGLWLWSSRIAFNTMTWYAMPGGR
jgi:hypothetical protein